MYELSRCSFDANPLYELIQSLAYHGPEASMKVESRKIGNLGQVLEGEFSIDVQLNVGNDTIDAEEILVPLILLSPVI